MKQTVLVVDDYERFALYAWWVLSRDIDLDCPRTGGEPEQYGEKPDESTSKLHRMWNAPDGTLDVGWIDSNNLPAAVISQNILEIAESREREVWVVIDVRLATKTDDPETLCRELAGNLLRGGMLKNRIRIVSSYRTQPIQVAVEGGEALLLAVNSKTPLTLEKLRDEVDEQRAKTRESWRSDASALKAPEDEGGIPVAHILITGAGFERGPDARFYGFPATSRLLAEMDLDSCSHATLRLERMFTSDEAGKLRDADPLPAFRIQDEKARKRMIRSCEQRNLDDYWDNALRYQQRIAAENPEVREAQEYELREAFRRSLLKYDVGYLDTCIWAARQTWTAWLTTNYSGFADRAIDFTEATKDSQAVSEIASSGRGEQLPVRHWRRVANPEQAAGLLPIYVMALDREAPEHPLLVKLHGEMGQVQTMAIAGRDKWPRSDLSVRIGLYELYSCSQEYLCQKAFKDHRFWWTICGHGLWDDRLLDLIEKVVSRQPARGHEFVIADPFPDDPRERLKERLPPTLARNRVSTIRCSARELMAKLDVVRLPARVRKDAFLSEWLTRARLKP